MGGRHTSHKDHIALEEFARGGKRPNKPLHTSHRCPGDRGFRTGQIGRSSM